MAVLSEEQMREAVARRDTSLDGRFYYGVVTTGVYCRPSCSSRAARPENLRFFSSVASAMADGFRPCKRCEPCVEESRSARLVDIARHIEAHPDERIILADLAAMAALSPSRFQRVFKAAFGITPKAYQDAVRVRRFKRSLQEGGGVTDAIFSSGFGSVSRVYGKAARAMGMTPGAYQGGGAGEAITYACRKTSLGFLGLAATDRGVCFVQFADDEAALVESLEAEFPAAALSASPARGAPELDAWVEALDQHLSEGAPRPDLPMDIRGTVFQVKVWQFLLGIAEGAVLSYSDVAAGIGRPKAARAVASACAKNRIGVLIPCHRVLRGDGGLGGYRWGLALKQALLELEKA